MQAAHERTSSHAGAASARTLFKRLAVHLPVLQHTLDGARAAGQRAQAHIREGDVPALAAANTAGAAAADDARAAPGLAVVHHLDPQLVQALLQVKHELDVGVGHNGREARGRGVG